MRLNPTEEDTPFVTLSRVWSALPLVMLALLFPTTSYAQATLAGVVRDSSGAILPGVTVEAASPALIEKVRTAVTDGTGQYQLVDLRPGTYIVTFSLSGFRTARREGVEVSGGGVITVNGEMSVGGVTETLIIQAETPVVETQTVRRQAVLENKTITDTARRPRLRSDSRCDSHPAGRWSELVVVGQSQLLQRTRRPRQRRARDGRRPERRRRVQRRRRVGQCLRHRQRAGNADLHLRLARGSGSWRPDAEHRAEDRWQHLLRHRVRQRCW